MKQILPLFFFIFFFINLYAEAPVVDCEFLTWETGSVQESTIVGDSLKVCIFSTETFTSTYSSEEEHSWSMTNLASGETLELPSSSNQISYYFDEAVDYELCVSVLSTIACQTILVGSPSVQNVTVSICENECYTISDSLVICEEGIYPFYLESSFGCDSTVYLNVEVIESSMVYIELSICQGEICIFDEQPITQAGTYYESLIASTGCDSLVILELSVLPAITTNQEVLLCNGESIFFGNQMITEPGTYFDALISSEGCDSTVSLSVEILSQTAVSDVVILDDDGSGSGSIEFEISGGLAPYTFQWDNGDSTQNINNLSAGLYVLTVTDDNGCQRNYYFEIILNTTAAESLLAENKIELFPNPVSAGEALSIKCESFAKVALKIYSITGQVISKAGQVSVKGDSCLEIMAPKRAGVYILEVMDMNNGAVYSLLFVVK